MLWPHACAFAVRTAQEPSVCPVQPSETLPGAVRSRCNPRLHARFVRPWTALIRRSRWPTASALHCRSTTCWSCCARAPAQRSTGRGGDAGISGNEASDHKALGRLSPASGTTPGGTTPGERPKVSCVEGKGSRTPQSSQAQQRGEQARKERAAQGQRGVQKGAAARAPPPWRHSAYHGLVMNSASKGAPMYTTAEEHQGEKDRKRWRLAF